MLKSAFLKEFAKSWGNVFF